MGGVRPRAAFVPAALLAAALSAPPRAEPLVVRPPSLQAGSTWIVLELDGLAISHLAGSLESGTFWDLRPAAGSGRAVRWRAGFVHEAGPSGVAAAPGADRALCAFDESSGERIGCRLIRAEETRATGPLVVGSDLPGDGGGALVARSTLGREGLQAGSEYEETIVERHGDRVWVRGRAIAEGVAVVPAGPREVVLVHETVTGSRAPVMRYRFLSTSGEEVAVLEGPLPAPGEALAPDRGAILLAGAPEANNGIQIRYPDFHQALLPGATGFLQYSLVANTPLSTLNVAWTSAAGMISIDQMNVPYLPDPGDPASQQILPEVWDFTGIARSSVPYRTFNSTRNDAGGGPCLNVCAVPDFGPTPPDGTWQSYLKIDTYAPSGAFFTRDIFELNDNDTGENPSIDVPFVAQDEMNTEGRTQVCFQQSAGGASRLLRFFRFTGAAPASAVLGVGDTWTSGSWTECDDSHGLRLTVASQCGSQCWPGCTSIDPRARGRLGSGAGFRMTVVEDGYVKVAAGNYIPALLLRQDSDIEAGLDFLLGICNLGTTRSYSFDYFWVNRKYGLLASVSAPDDPSASMPPDDWTAVGNVTDGADFSWGPFPPYQTEALACLSGTLVRWRLPADGSNLSGEPRITDYGYVVSWGSQNDPEILADWATNPNHTALPGQLGYLAAPPGGEPTSTVITSWGGAAINATVVTALRYTDPDLADQRTYRSAAFYKVVEDPARLSASTFVVGNQVAPFVSPSGGSDVQLAWPAVAGAGSYRIRVWDLATKAEIPCPPGLNCTPSGNSVVHAGGATATTSFGYRIFAVDPCGGVSAN